MTETTVTRLRSMLSWHQGQGLWSHHYYEAPELGQSHTACTEDDHGRLRELEAVILQHIGPHTYSIGARVLTVQPQMEWFQLRFFHDFVEVEATVRLPGVHVHGDAIHFHRLVLHEFAPDHLTRWVVDRHDDCHEDHGLARHWRKSVGP